MSRPTIYIDMDGVLCSWTGGHLDWRKIKDTSEGFWEKDKILQFVTKQEIEDLKPNYLFWANLPKYKWAERIVQTVVDTGCDWRFLTLAPNQMGGYGGKIDWIKRYFPQYANRLVIAQDEKTFACKPGDILIDDYIKNIDEWQAAGGKPIHWPELSRSAEELAESQLVLLKLTLDAHLGREINLGFIPAECEQSHY